MNLLHELNIPPNYTNSVVQEATIFGKKYFIKRDDLIHEYFSGNKARKFYYFLHNDFPGITTLESTGGSQSNAMLSLAALAHLKEWKFVYYTRPISQFLKNNPRGNFKYALDLGMHYVETDAIPSESQLPDSMWINHGGAMPEAEMGLQMLANEIQDFARNINLSSLSVFLPSGTGSSSLYLQKNLPFRVYTFPAAGSADYLRSLFTQLEPDESLHPIIITPHKKYQFGKPHPDLLTMWLELKQQTEVPFELIYDTIGWSILKNIHLPEPVMYVHCGGLLANESMLDRYRREKILTDTNFL